MGKFIRKVFNLTKVETPDYFGKEVFGELNGHQYRGFVEAKRGEYYLIDLPDGTKQMVTNIRRIGDLIVRRQ